MMNVLEELRSASIARNAQRLANLYAVDGVHHFPFVVPGAPTRIEGRAAIAEFNSTVYKHLPLAYTEYRTLAAHRVSESVLVVEQEAIGSNAQTGVPFAFPNVWVIQVDEEGLIVSLRDYVNPVAVHDALGDVSGAFAERSG